MGSVFFWGHPVIQSLSTRFEENHKLFDELLQAGKKRKNLSVQNN